jgi:hypothetical protein
MLPWLVMTAPRHSERELDDAERAQRPRRQGALSSATTILNQPACARIRLA